jgi:hypothetical protein
MHIKTKTGKSFGGCVRYCMEKEKAEVLHTEGLRMDSAAHMTEDFNLVRKVNPDLGKAVWHTNISFAPEDTAKVTNEMMISIARDYAAKFKLEQYAVIRHHDTDHEHFHIIGNRVGYDGETVKDNYCGSRGEELAVRLEKKYELHHQQGKRLEKTHKEKLKGKDKVKYEIYEAVQKELPKATSIEDLQTKLQTHGINTVVQEQGLSFAKGEQHFKATAVDRDFGLKNIVKTIENIVARTLEKIIPAIREVSQLKRELKRNRGMEM